MGQVFQPQADVLQGLAKILSPMRCDQEESGAGLRKELGANRPGSYPLAQQGCQPRRWRQPCHLVQGIDDRVAGNQDAPLGDPLIEQVLAGPLGRSQVEVGNDSHHPAVHLLREGLPLVVGTQAGLHMGHCDSRIKGSQGCSSGGGGISLDYYPVRLLSPQERLQGRQYGGGNPAGCLVWLHEVEVIVRDNGKELEHLVQHLTVLAGNTDPGLQVSILRPLP
jgi:hypothetical protein